MDLTQWPDYRQMNSQEAFARFQNELSHLSVIALDVKIASDVAGKPSDALCFAEAILMCPTEDAAKLQMRQNQKGAVAFFQIADFVVSEFGKLDIPTSRASLKDVGPFFVIGSCVQDYLNFLKRKVGDEWK